MKKKILSIILSVAMVSTLFAGCGEKKEDMPDKEPQTETQSTTDDATNDATTTDDSAGSADNATSSGNSNYKIVVMPKLVGIPYFTKTGEGAMNAGKDLGVEVIYNGPTTADAAEQVKMLEDYINQGVNAICVAPNDPAALDPVLKKARDAGILVLDWDTPATPELVDASVHQVSDQEIAEHMINKMVEYMGTDTGEWAILTGGLSAKNLNTWIDFGKAYAKKNCPNLKLVSDPYPTDEKQDLALSTTKDILKAYPNVKGLYCVSTPTPIGAALAIRELGLQDKVTVVGTAVEEDCQDVLTDGSLDCGCLWNCQDLGYLTVVVAKYLLDGNKLDANATIPGVAPEVTVIDDKNVLLGPPADYEADKTAQ